jgi:hypothetical protein
MQRYRNFSGTSGVKYVSGPLYRYSYETVGRESVEEMKRLARKGSHLNAFINRRPEIRRGFVKEAAKVPE